MLSTAVLLSIQAMMLQNPNHSFESIKSLLNSEDLVQFDNLLSETKNISNINEPEKEKLNAFVFKGINNLSKISGAQRVRPT